MLAELRQEHELFARYKREVEVTPTLWAGIEARINAATGTTDDWRKQADEWHVLGATHLTVNTMGAGLKGPDAHIARLREAIDALRVLTS